MHFKFAVTLPVSAANAEKLCVHLLMQFSYHSGCVHFMTVHINLYADYSADVAHKAVSSVELQHFPSSSTPRLLPLRDGEWRKNSTIWTCGKLRENWKGQKTPGKTSPRGRERAFGSLLLSAWIKKRWSLEVRHWRAPTSTRSCQTSWLLPRGRHWYPSEQNMPPCTPIALLFKDSFTYWLLFMYLFVVLLY